MKATLAEQGMLIEPLKYAVSAPASKQETGCQCYFVKAKLNKTPAELLRVVLSYCGLDQSLREVGGAMALRRQPLCDQSVRERLVACQL